MGIFDDIAIELQYGATRLFGPGITSELLGYAPYIDGIEATQSIQYYKSSQHLTDPATRGMDNAIVLAAYKPAWVRAYVRGGTAAPATSLTGRLTVERRDRGFLWGTVTTLNSRPPGILNANTDYATERGSTFNTLNFIIPASDCWGILRLTVELIDSGGRNWGTFSDTVRATLKQTLRLRAILIAYNGPSTSVMIAGQPPPPNITLNAPTLANLQNTSAMALLAMPVQSTGNFAVASTITFNLPLDDPRTGAGECSTNWGTLLDQLTTERTNDGNRADCVYYGLLPAGMPLNVPGCGRNGLGAGGVGDQNTLLHEIGHGYGFMHTPCGAAGTTDPNYPNYAPYPSASIGEYGLDVSNGNVLTPQGTSDYMSYCFPQWISLYQYQRLVGHARLDPSWISDNPIWDQYSRYKDYIIPEYIPDPPFRPWQVVQVRPDHVISIIGIVHRNNEVEVTSVARVRAVPTPSGQPTSFHARLLDANGRELASAPLYRLAQHGGGCGCGDGESHRDQPPFHFQAMIADIAPGAALTIDAAEKVIWERHAPAQPPLVSALRAELMPPARARLSWETDASGERLDVWAQWSKDGGKVWHGLATGLTGNSAEVSLAYLPAGEVLLRVLVNDGFHTAVSEPARVQVPRQPPEAAILTPGDGHSCMAGAPLRLWAAATDNSGTPLPDDACLWILDGHEVGRGTDLWVQAPPAGEHRVTLIVRAESDEVRRTAHFTSIDTGVDPHCP